MTAYLTAAFIVFVLWTVLLPATLTAVNSVVQWRRTAEPASAARFPVCLASRRPVVPVAA